MWKINCVLFHPFIKMEYFSVIWILGYLTQTFKIWKIARLTAFLKSACWMPSKYALPTKNTSFLPFHFQGIWENLLDKERAIKKAIAGMFPLKKFFLVDIYFCVKLGGGVFHLCQIFDPNKKKHARWRQWKECFYEVLFLKIVKCWKVTPFVVSVLES